VFTSHQRRFLALLSAMGAAGAQVAAGFPHDPTNAQAAWFGLTVILTGLAGVLVAGDYRTSDVVASKKNITSWKQLGRVERFLLT